jgi:hypothetical protein
MHQLNLATGYPQLRKILKKNKIFLAMDNPVSRKIKVACHVKTVIRTAGSKLK